MSSRSPTGAPERWRQARLGQVAACILGGTPSTDVPQFWGGDVPWMASGDVHLRRIEDVPGRITDRGLRSSNATLTDPPAVAVGLAGQGKTRGTVALTLCRLSTNQSIALLKANGIDLRTDYLFHNLDRRYEELRARSSGGGRGGLSKGILESVPIELPSLDEQEAIARILDIVDTDIHETEAIIAKLKAIKQGLLHDVLTRGIDENGELRPLHVEAPHRYKESPVGQIPKEWKFGPLHAWLNGKPKNGYSPQEAGEWTGIQMLGLGCLTPDGFEPIQLKSAPRGDRRLLAAMLANGDLLMSRSNTRDLVGLAGIYRDVGTPCTYPDLMMRLQPSPETSGEFLQFVLRSPALRRQIQANAVGTSGSMVKISGAIVVRLVLAMPSENEQVRILSCLSTGEARLNAEIEKLLALRSLKSGLMDDLLTGRVRVTELLDSATTMPA